MKDGSLKRTAGEEEIVVIVDENNQVTGSEPRSIMRSKGLIHRACYIMVFNSYGELFVQTRTKTKDIYPGYRDIATGGVVSHGESYDAAAYRELEEEMGIKGVVLTPLFTFYYEKEKNRVWGKAYTCVYDGEITLQEEEVESGDFFPISSILKIAQRHSFTPDGLYLLDRYLKTASAEKK